MKVLVGDHSDAVRTRLVARLRECGLDVVGEADTLSEATMLAIRLQPDAVVTDINFRDGRGGTVVRTIRESAPAALVVVLSNALHFRPLCLASGAHFFLDKSTEFDDVAPTVMRSPRRL